MPKIRTKSPIHENADANITCDFGDGDISRSRSRLPHTHTHTSLARLYLDLLATINKHLFPQDCSVTSGDTMLCDSPKFNLSTATSRRRRDTDGDATYLADSNLQFYIGFLLDGVTAYRCELLLLSSGSSIREDCKLNVSLVI